MPRIPGLRAEFYAGLREDLKDFAEATFTLDAPQPDGSRFRDHLEGLLARASDPAQRRKIEGELFGPAMPPEFRYLWSAFGRLSGRRRLSDVGALPIAWDEIDAFSRLTGAAFVPWEIEVIEMLDRLFLESLRSPSPSGSPPAK